MKVKSIRLIWIIAFFLILLSILGIVTYLKTNFFKSNELLFKKYFSKNIDNVANLFDFSKQSEKVQKILENDYTEEMSINLKYTDENEENFTIKGKGIINNSEKSSYRKISCNYKDEDILDIELLKQNDIYGLRFTNLIKQFVSIENKDISHLLSNLGYNGEYVENKINFDNIDIFGLIEFTEEECNKLKEEYAKLIFENLDKQNYSSKSNSLITLNNGESVNTKSYMLMVNKNELDNICRRIINKAIDDEVILGKINKIDDAISNLGIKEKENLQSRYKSKLQEIYDSMDYKGEDDRKFVITAYAKNDEVVRIYVKTEFVEYYIDKDTKQDNAMSLKIVKLTNEGTDTRVFSLVNSDIIKYKYNNNDNTYFEVNVSNEVENDKLNLINNISYESENISPINIFIENKYDFSTNEEINVTFEKNRNILLNKYDKETIQYISDSLENIIIKKLKESQERINSNMLDKIINYINNEHQEILEERKEEFEEKKKGFNNKFLLYEGKKVEYENIKKLLYVTGKNMKEYKVSDDNIIRIYLEENKDNTEKANEILNLLTEQDLYNVKMNYSEDGMIESIDLSIFKEKKED